MTDTEDLKRRGLTDEDIEAMQNMGFDLRYYNDPKAAFNLAAYYNNAGIIDKVGDMINLGNQNVDFWVSTIQDLTGLNVVYNDVADRWINTDNGQFVRSPNVLTWQNQSDFEHSVIALYE